MMLDIALHRATAAGAMAHGRCSRQEPALEGEWQDSVEEQVVGDTAGSVWAALIGRS
jgi:hypothetical protein